MWSKTYGKILKGICAEDIWAVWVDVNQWHTWGHEDMEYAKLTDEFKAGSTFMFKLKNGPKFNVELIKVEPKKSFTNLTMLPGAKMYGIHELIINGDELEIRITMAVKGWLSFIWRRHVVEQIVNCQETQTNALIQRVKEINRNNLLGVQ